MANKNLTAQQARERLTYDPLTGVFHWINPCARRQSNGGIAGGGQPGAYWRITIGKQQYLAHRLAWLMHYGQWPSKFIDHRDGNRSNNAITNLRDVDNATNAQNGWRPRSNNASGFLGAAWNARCKKWQAAIKTGDKREFIGSFDTAEQAHKAYIKRKIERHGLP